MKITLLSTLPKDGPSNVTVEVQWKIHEDITKHALAQVSLAENYLNTYLRHRFLESLEYFLVTILCPELDRVRANFLISMHTPLSEIIEDFHRLGFQRELEYENGRLNKVKLTHLEFSRERTDPVLLTIYVR